MVFELRYLLNDPHMKLFSLNFLYLKAKRIIRKNISTAKQQNGHFLSILCKPMIFLVNEVTL